MTTHPKQKPLTVARLSDLGSGDVLHAHCRDCQRFATLDVKAIGSRHGDLEFAALKARLVCRACGGRHIALVHGWSTGPLTYHTNGSKQKKPGPEDPG